MGIFDKLFGESNKVEALPEVHWFYLEQTPLDEIVKKSFEKPVVIFKHSTRCSISRFVLKQFEMEYDIPTNQMELYFLDLLEHRSISNEVAERFGIMHQSPQVIVIKDGKAIYDTSHESIQAKNLNQFV